MSNADITRATPAGPSFQELFTPKLITALKEGYGLARLKADAVAGLTVAIVALPLSMAIAIASGASPAQGLYTAIVGGFFVSLLGGSRFQIGGPAGAFIVLVATTVQTHGMDGLLIATILSGLMLVAIGFLRLGTYIKFVPYPVTVGFTAGIAVIIFSSQIKDLLGLTLARPEPGPLLDKLPVLWESLPSLDPATVFLALATIVGISVLKHIRPHWPGLLLAVAGAAAVTALLDLDVATIGSRFGGIPSHPPIPSLPAVTMDKVIAVLPSAFAFTLLGSIESLLSAVVADGMTGRRHRSNCELVAQGVANVASGIFGGVCVTGTIARTATNVRAGAATPIAGMLHSGFLLTFILVAAPLASYIPLASLAGVLAIVAWNMIEKQAIRTLMTASRGDAAVLLTTFLLTIFRDLTEAIVVGFALGSVLFIHRMSKTTAIETDTPFVAEDEADPVGGRGGAAPSDPEVVVFRISGAFFFGAAASIGSVLDRIADTHRVLIVDFAAVPFLDSTAAETIRGMAEKAERRHVRVIITGTDHGLRRVLFAHGVKPPLVAYERAIADALENTKTA
ncbi:SulP family inorganic anion transporter [Rhodobium gokarnense]|uniref:SulP family sulfate permease n=1 Tax=Rhodobium gokarnense TaxID=364296 RepID=A0ABT3H7A6_9HYPH|nr:SulP family inorganic anion transporter [Rhodobium gokarnense]MCW2306260.1 SulP family sulfate permease [Rhodobium gokarnense]